MHSLKKQVVDHRLKSDRSNRFLNQPSESFLVTPIGFVQTIFREKFGVPRQSGMIPEARAVIKLNPDPNFRDGLRKLEDFSHLWILFHFHEHAGEPWRPLTTPPRVDAPGRVGVFASRSPHRPNAIGMSAVKLDRIDLQATGGIEIHVSGVDLLDGTPVIDLKPYVPYVDALPNADGGWTETEIPKYEVQFSPNALQELKALEERTAPRAELPGLQGISAASPAKTDLKLLIRQMLEIDPRPTSQKKAFPIESPKSEGMGFAFRLGELDIHWTIAANKLLVTRVMNPKN